MWPLSWLAYVVSQMLSSSCLQGLSMCCLVVCRLSPEMWSQNCPHIETFDTSDLFPRIGLEIISTCLPFVALLFSSCLLDLSDVVPHLPPSCLVLVLQIWSFHYLRVSSSVLSRFSPGCFALNPTMPSCLPDLVPQYFRTVSHLLSNCFRAASQMWSPSCLLDVSQVRLPRCCLPVASKVSTLVRESSSCRQDVVSQLSPTCGFPGVVSQLFPTLLHLLPSLPPVSQMWSPSCLPDVVS